MKAIVLTPPSINFETPSGYKKIFLAGSIEMGKAEDWQQKVITAVSDFEKVIYNPRRENFPINDPNASEQQIVWEFNHLRDSDIIIFWFSKGSLNPIVLYELGKWGNSTNKPIFVGCDQEYERKLDVEIQTKLARGNIKIYSDLKEMCDEIVGMLNSENQRNF